LLVEFPCSAALGVLLVFLLGGRVTGPAHRRLLVVAGWDSLLVAHAARAHRRRVLGRVAALGGVAHRVTLRALRRLLRLARVGSLPGGAAVLLRLGLRRRGRRRLVRFTVARGRVALRLGIGRRAALRLIGRRLVRPAGGLGVRLRRTGVVRGV